MNIFSFTSFLVLSSDVIIRESLFGIMNKRECKQLLTLVIICTIFFNCRIAEEKNITLYEY